MSKYLDFDYIGSSGSGRTDIWNVLSKNTQGILGKISWYGPWRQYCFFPSPHCVFNNTCMADISKHIKELMDNRKKDLKELMDNRKKDRTAEV